jgi:hypothetical protein
MRTAQFASLLGALAAAPDLEGASCVGHAEMFDITDDPAVTAVTQRICAECPVLARCRDWSAGFTNRELSGVVAGAIRPWEPRVAGVA